MPGANAALKIGFVLDDSLDKADGVQQYILTLGAWLSVQGHDVHYLVGQTSRRDLASIHSLSKNLAVRFNHNRMSMPLPASKKAIRALLDLEQFDILHVQLPYSPWLAGRIISASGSQTAVIGTFHIVPHDFTVKAASKVLAVWTRASLQRFDEILSVSSAAQSFAKKTFKIDSQILPNVVDYQRFAKARALEKYKGKLTIVYLGRLVPRKGCMLLLQALDQLLKQAHDLPAFRVVICSRGPLEARLKAYASEHHLESCVEFTGFVSEKDKPRYLASADIAVFPSTGGESFGIVLIEAMAAGHAAVLGGNNVGYASVMQERQDLLFPPKNIAAFADKLSVFLRHKAQRLEAKNWGKEHAKQFDVAVVGKKLLAVYDEALRKKQ